MDELPKTVPPAGYRALLWLSVGILSAFVAVSIFVLQDMATSDETRGAVVQTWNNLAVAIAAFWFNSTVTSRVQKLKEPGQ